MREQSKNKSPKNHTTTVIVTERPAAADEQDLFSMPPIILDGEARSSKKAVSAFIRKHKNNGNMPAAREEAKRLAPYFKSWGNRLKEAFDKLKNKETASETRNSKMVRWSRYHLLKAEMLPPLLEPGNLSRLFTEIAAHNRTTLLSSVILVPTGSFEGDGILFPYVDSGNGNKFSQGTNYLHHRVDFGFLQVYSQSGAEGSLEELMPRSSISIPVLGLDRDLLKAIEPHGGEALLRHFQDALTWANHDMLHHFTADLVNNRVADNFFQGQEPLREWDKTYTPGHGDSAPDGYEGWANTSQAKTWQYLSKTDIGENFHRNVDAFLVELERISRALQEDGNITEEKRHQVIDYFGTLMGFTIARIFPLDSPVLTGFIDRLEKIDPTPAVIFEEEKRSTDCRKIIESYLSEDSFSQTSAEPVLKVVDALLKSASIGGNGEDFRETFRNTFYYAYDVGGEAENDLEGVVTCHVHFCSFLEEKKQVFVPQDMLVHIQGAKTMLILSAK